MSHEIKFIVDLDEEKFPEKIEWTAEGNGADSIKAAKALLISLWDKNDNVTLAIDLWTKDMLVNDMGYLYYQTLIHLAESYERATSDKTAADILRETAEKLADHLKLSQNPSAPEQTPQNEKTDKPA